MVCSVQSTRCTIFPFIFSIAIKLDIIERFIKKKKLEEAKLLSVSTNEIQFYVIPNPMFFMVYMLTHQKAASAPQLVIHLVTHLQPGRWGAMCTITGRSWRQQRKTWPKPKMIKIGVMILQHPDWAQNCQLRIWKVSFPKISDMREENKKSTVSQIGISLNPYWVPSHLGSGDYHLRIFRT